MIRRDFANDIRKLHDELAANTVLRSGHSKFASLAMTYLEQARYMVIAHGVEHDHTHLIVDKRQYAELLEMSKDHVPKTVETE